MTYRPTVVPVSTYRFQVQPAFTFDDAAAQGRLGVRESVCGRVKDLGGTATLDTGRHGTTWRLVVPRERS